VKVGHDLKFFVSLQIRQSTQNRKSQLENVSIDWNLSQDEAGSIDLSDEDMTVIENTAVNSNSKISFNFFLVNFICILFYKTERNSNS
jgi:hypothetical protein